MGLYIFGFAAGQAIRRFITPGRRGKLLMKKLRMDTISFDRINQGLDLPPDGPVLRQVRLRRG
nr:hypothetical protein [uncultured Rhodopila sp.]